MIKIILDEGSKEVAIFKAFPINQKYIYLKLVGVVMGYQHIVKKGEIANRISESSIGAVAGKYK